MGVDYPQSEIDASRSYSEESYWRRWGPTNQVLTVYSRNTPGCVLTRHPDVSGRICQVDYVEWLVDDGKSAIHDMDVAWGPLCLSSLPQERWLIALLAAEVALLLLALLTRAQPTVQYVIFILCCESSAISESRMLVIRSQPEGCLFFLINGEENWLASPLSCSYQAFIFLSLLP